MKNIIKYKKGEHSFVGWIKKRIKNNLNFLVIAEGETGIGKSWGLISIAYLIDKDFESRQVAFSFKQVMEIISSDWFNAKEWKVIIFDEAQTNISNRAWQSLTNKLFNYLLSTFRHRNIIFMMTSPYSDFLDSQTMKLIHCTFSIRGHNKKQKETKIRPLLLQYNPQRKKTYYHSLFVIKNSRYNKLVNWLVPIPPQHLIKPYEQDKISFTDRLNKNIIDELVILENNKGEIDTRKPLTAKQRNILILYKELGQVQLVAQKLGLAKPTISNQMKLARKKGYTPENMPISVG